MTRKTLKKPKLVIAGPGAGKTFCMVEEILAVIPDLAPSRFLVAVTYTNSAAYSIRSRLSKVMQIPQNIFIGTNHSFISQFIFKPYATIFEDIPYDTTYFDANITVDHEDPGAKVRIRHSIIKELVRKGKIPFDKIISISAKLMKNKLIRRMVCNRIQYLFVDEFQDLDTSQLKIFDAIRKEKRTKFFAVGDPEQCILGFTYSKRSLKKPEFEFIPFFRFKKYSQCERRKENRRSFSEIVEFINQFHTEIEQFSTRGSCGYSGVYFINLTRLDLIIEKYRELTRVLDSHCKDDEEVVRFYLSYAENTFGEPAKKYNLTPVSNTQIGANNLLDEALQMISAVTKMSHREVQEKYNLDPIAYRKLGMSVIRAIRSGDIRKKDDLISFLYNVLGSDFGSEKVQVQIGRNISSMKNIFTDEPIPSLHLYSTIHKAKGLEADAVLVLAESENRLKKWLLTDKQERYSDKSDQCRIGYVAFSRAKTILCIACQEKIDSNLRNHLHGLGVKITPPGVEQLCLF